MIRIAVLAVIAACSPILSGQSMPPPGRTAAFEDNDGHYDLALSQGVAYAITCFRDGPCKDVVVSTEDAQIADVRAASIGEPTLAAVQARTPGYRVSTATTAGFVVIGKAPGKTRVKVKTSKGSKTIHVEVLAPPPSGEPATVARP